MEGKVEAYQGVVGHYGEGDLEACEVVGTWIKAELRRYGDGCSEVMDVVREEEVREDEGEGGQGRSPCDHLGLERSSLLSSTHKTRHSLALDS